MRVRLVAAVAAALALLTGVTTPAAHASQPGAGYKTCNALWKKYPTGLALTGSAGRYYWANAAVAAGYQKPRVVSDSIFFASDRRSMRATGFVGSTFVLCARKPKPMVPPAPANLSATAATVVVGMVSVVFQMPAAVLPKPVYDIYADGALVKTETYYGAPANGVYTFYPTLTGLTPNTAYEIKVIARNEAGSSAPAFTQVTTAPPPKTTYTIEYTAGCGSGDCSITVDNASGGEDRFDPSGGGTWTYKVSKASYKIYSVFVWDNTFSSSTSCQIKVDGRVVKTSTSTGGASASCYYATP